MMIRILLGLLLCCGMASLKAQAHLKWSTFLGGLEPGLNGRMGDFVLDAEGYIYGVGTFDTGGFPATAGAFDTQGNGLDDVVAFKLSPEGDSLIWGTYLGGSRGDQGVDIQIDEAGNVFVLAQSYSDDWPMRAGAFQPVSGDAGLFNYELVLCKLSPDGAQLLASTYFGGLGDDFAGELARGPNGDLFVCGYTNGGDIPTTAGAFDESFNGAAGFSDLFVFRIREDLSQLIYSTYVGGNESDSAEDLVVNEAGEAIFTGEVNSFDYPVSPNAAFPNKFSLNAAAFVSKLSADGSQLLMSTYLPGEQGDHGREIDLGPNGEIVVAGRTYSHFFPLTAGALDSTMSGPLDIFLCKVSPDGSQLLYSTYLGGRFYDHVHDLKVNARGEIFLVGSLTSDDLSSSPCAFDSTYAGGGNNFEGDLFLVKISANADSLLYASYLGGTGAENFPKLALKTQPCTEEIVIGGTIYSPDFPISENALQDSIFPGNGALAFTSLRENLDLRITVQDDSCPQPGQSLQLGFEGAICGQWTDLRELEWDFGDGTQRLDSFPQHVYAESGTYEVLLRVPGCPDPLDDLTLNLSGLNLGPDLFACPNERLWVDGSLPGNSLYLWNDGIRSPRRELEREGVYVLEVLTEAGCTLTDSIELHILHREDIFIPNVLTPNQDSYNDTWVIEGIERGFWQVEIYDRWGNQIFQSSNYANDWDGGDYPEGVYYYVVQGPEPCGRFTGTLTLLR